MKLQQLCETTQIPMPKRKLGKIPYDVSILSLGGQGSLETQGTEKNCVEIIESAYQLGINYFDTSPIYGPSEDYYGKAMPSFRKNVFLASKTDDRTYDGSLRLLEKSLKRLKTDYLDLWQLHHIGDNIDLEKCMDKDGVISALLKMKEEKVVRHIGVTGHENPLTLKTIIKEFDFDTILCPINAADIHNTPSFIKDLIPIANQKRMGIIGMKVFSQGHIFNKNGLTTPWGPISYALSQHVSTIIIGHDSVEQLRENVAIAKSFVQLTTNELKDIEKKTKTYYKKASFFRSMYGGYNSRDKLSEPIQIVPNKHG